MTKTEKIEEMMNRYGWNVDEGFWERYQNDPLVYNLTNALLNTTESQKKHGL